VRLVESFQPLFERFPAEHHPTFFEALTVMALRYFAEQQCDLVIWETGLGGRLDATNIVTPLASVITNIGLDHQQWLGDTLAEIAAEKAGIIKPGVPALTATNETEALAVIEAMARQAECAAYRSRTGVAPVSIWQEKEYRDRRDACPTVARGSPATQRRARSRSRHALQNQIPVSDEQMRAGLAQVNWPGRLQIVTPRKRAASIARLRT